MMTLPVPSRLSPPPARRPIHGPPSWLIWAVTGLALLIVALAWRPDPDAIDLAGRLQPPFGFGGTSEHVFGTDQLGRDLGARMAAGARVSLLVAVTATLVAGAIGSIIGLTGGYFGGLADRIGLWIGDVQLAVPFVIVAIGISATIKPSVTGVILILGATGWATYARVARLTVQPLRRAAFVDAARVNGASPGRILFRHLLPVILPPLLALAGQQAGAMILYESALSFLGIGVPASTITWGRMIADSRDSIGVAWWATVLPGLAIVAVVCLFNAIGQFGIRRLRGGEE
jgi:peptide/nickel transport system permease protein